MSLYLVDLTLDGYDTGKESEEAGVEFIEEQLNFSASSVRVSLISPSSYDHKPQNSDCSEDSLIWVWDDNDHSSGGWKLMLKDTYIALYNRYGSYAPKWLPYNSLPDLNKENENND